jgi:hypothetical protein
MLSYCTALSLLSSNIWASTAISSRHIVKYRGTLAHIPYNARNAGAAIQYLLKGVTDAQAPLYLYWTLSKSNGFPARNLIPRSAASDKYHLMQVKRSNTQSAT